MKLAIDRRWFIEIEGRAQGPFTQEQVEDLSRLKRVTPLTRIFLEGDVRWRLMNEFSEFNLAPDSANPGQIREWVVLKRKTLKEAELSQNKFDQVGPFSVDEIFEQLTTGDLSYNDYAWKKGFQRWAKLEALPEFNHTIKLATPTMPAVPSAAIAFLNEPKLELDSAEQNELDEFTATNSRSLEASDSGLTKESIDKPKGGSTKSVRAIEEQIVQHSRSDEDEIENQEVALESSDPSVVLRPGLSRGRKVLRVALASVATCVVTALAYNFVKENYSPPSVENAVNEVVSVAGSESQLPPLADEAAPAPALALVQDSKPEVSQVAQAEKPVAKKLPVYTKTDYEMPKNPVIDFEVLQPETTGQVVFSTNAPVNFPIEVKITGKSGQILRYTSYSQTLKVQRQGGEVPSVQLSALRLPHGTYTVEAKFADLTKQKSFFYGVRDANFQKSLTAHLKKISTEQILEKKMVFYFLRDLEDQAKKLESERAKLAKNKADKDKANWKKAYSAWRKDVFKVSSKSFSRLKKMNNRDVAYPEIISKARELSQQLLKQGEELNSAVVQNRNLASSGIKPILNAIRDFKKEVSLLSRY